MSDTTLAAQRPPLPLAAKVFFAAVVFIVMLGGGLLLVAPERLVPRWPWALPPFNARFLAAVYLTECAVVANALLRNRWPLGRFVVTLAIPFATLVTIATLLHADALPIERFAVKLWYVLYAGSALTAIYLVWRYRDPGVSAPVALGERDTALVRWVGIVLLAYSAALFLIPETAAGFWPWRVDALHGRVYSGFFSALGLGAFLLAQRPGRDELFGQGLGQTVLGVLAIVGLLLVDAQLGRVSWSSLGTWIWLAAAAGLAAHGVRLLGIARATS